jgi:hypothetical protein
VGSIRLSPLPPSSLPPCAWSCLNLISRQKTGREMWAHKSANSHPDLAYQTQQASLREQGQLQRRGAGTLLGWGTSSCHWTKALSPTHVHRGLPRALHHQTRYRKPSYIVLFPHAVSWSGGLGWAERKLRAGVPRETKTPWGVGSRSDWGGG